MRAESPMLSIHPGHDLADRDDRGIRGKNSPQAAVRGRLREYLLLRVRAVLARLQKPTSAPPRRLRANTDVEIGQCSETGTKIVWGPADPVRDGITDLNARIGDRCKVTAQPTTCAIRRPIEAAAEDRCAAGAIVTPPYSRRRRGEDMAGVKSEAFDACSRSIREVRLVHRAAPSARGRKAGARLGLGAFVIGKIQAVSGGAEHRRRDQHDGDAHSAPICIPVRGRLWLIAAFEAQ